MMDASDEIQSLKGSNDAGKSLWSFLW
jgi:hypothetical protein